MAEGDRQAKRAGKGDRNSTDTVPSLGGVQTVQGSCWNLLRVLGTGVECAGKFLYFLSINPLVLRR